MSSIATTPARAEAAPRAVMQLAPRTAALAGGVLGLIFVAVFWDFFRTQAQSSVTHLEDWGHTLVIPFVAAWFVWLRRDRLLARPLRPAWTGLGFLVAGMAWYSACLFGPAIFQHNNLRGAGVFTSLFGIALLLCGWRAMKWLWFPIAYWAVFGQTISDRAIQPLTLRLQDMAAYGAYVALSILGFDTDISGNVLTVYDAKGVDHPLNVADACSGMRMLVAFVALGTAIAFLGLPKLWQRIVMIVMGVPVALFVNVLRVATLGMLSLANMHMIEGQFHFLVGVIWLVPAFLLYLGLQWLLLMIGATFSSSSRSGKGASHAI